MLKDIISLLNKHEGVDEYLINQVDDTSKELFFIKDQLQMTRGKDVQRISITVYKNFEEDGVKYKGSSTISKISTLTSLEELATKIDMAILAAGNVRNQYYDLVSPTDKLPKEVTSTFNDGNITDHIANLVTDLFHEDKDKFVFINSCEFFIHKRKVRILNSNKVDVNYTYYYGEIELVTEGKKGNEEVELFDVLHFSDYDPVWVKATVKDALMKTKLRLEAQPLPQLKDIPVILTGEAVKEFFSYYSAKASGNMKYLGIFDNKLDESVYYEAVTGDHVSITLSPEIKNSTESKYYDGSGFLLEETKIIKDGILIQYQAGKRIADYLEINPTGAIGNTKVASGTKTLEELKKGPYLMPLSFSDVQMDAMTGNFGGEIRLAIYFDGEKEIPVTLGSISSTIKLVEKDMVFSIEMERQNNFVGPKYVKLNGVGIVGN